MQIHVVAPGETLRQIAQSYKIKEGDISTLNQLEEPNRLVVGQALIIPIVGGYHWVAPGQSLYQISQMYQVPVQEISKANRIVDPDQIAPGTRLYIPPAPKRTVDVSAYANLEISETKVIDVLNQVGKYLTYVTVFHYSFDENGSLSNLNDEQVIETAYQNHIIPLMVLTNIAEGGFSHELVTNVLNSDAKQKQLIQNIINKLMEKRYRGVDMDLEFLGAENKELYVQFQQKLRSALKKNSYMLTTALPPKTSATQTGVLYAGHDYQALGQVNDLVFLMTYEWGWTGGPPMAVAPINEVEKVVNYALSEIPANKIMLGIPLYGYDWTLPYEPGVTRAKAISSQEAIRLALRYHAQIMYDYVAQSPHFQYTDEQGRLHEVWFEDARSLQAKFNLVKKYKLRGFFYWVLGFDLPQNWLLIEDNFQVRKRI